jgi:hypothetical protein
MKIKQELLNKARQYGREAYHSKITASCQDRRLMAIVEDLHLPVGGGSVELFKTWYKGSREEADKATAHLFEK